MMRTIAFVGPSGTGKSHKASIVARSNGADAIIDDGLLISSNRVIAGISAKKAQTKLASVRQALFIEGNSAEEMIAAIKNLNPQCIMILGTSDGMVKKIAEALALPEIENIIYIEDVATAEEIELARESRLKEGKHIIPVPAFEVKHQFSGYFLHPFRLFQKNLNPRFDNEEDKTIVRPSFSYLGNYTISDNVIVSAVKYEAMKEKCLDRINSVNLRTSQHGIHIDVTFTVKYSENITEICKRVQRYIKDGVELNTSVNVRRVNVYVKALTV